MHKVGEIEYLLSKRYDRKVDEGGTIHRLHQKDFCQALAIPSEIKYQAEGGPGLKDCFALLRFASSSPVVDLRELLNAIFFNLLIGNTDAHTKNYSLLYGRDGKARLAPLYDLVCTVYYPEIENRLAMEIGGEANPDLIYPKEIEVFAKEAGLAAAATKRSVSDMAALVLEKSAKIEQPDETAEKLAKLVAERCEKVLSRFK
ncbi:MAG: HipA domain-containing protein [Pseudomonadales bacterium]|nr:HipA domain-containing protein [Pseudomonadales bacterium]